MCIYCRLLEVAESSIKNIEDLLNSKSTLDKKEIETAYKTAGLKEDLIFIKKDLRELKKERMKEHLNERLN